MARSLGFAAYRAFSRRLSRPSPAAAPPRPDGQVLWLHAASGERVDPLYQLALRIQNQRDDLLVLITFDGDEDDALEDSSREIRFERIASDHPAEAVQFLDHWRPDICLWAGAKLMPNLISQAGERNIPMILIDVGGDEFPSRNHKWFPDLTRESLTRFESIITAGPEVSAMLRRIGVPAAKISQGEPLGNGPSPQPVDEEELSRTADQLGGRPLWLAAHVQASEFEAVLAAHRYALRFNHRLLLVIAVDDPKALDLLSETLCKSKKRYSQWRDSDSIDDNTQVLISDGRDDLGLWYRMAPLTFVGSSLGISDTGRCPLQAVALGSAILFGPHVAKFRTTYSRLVSVGAARSLKDGNALGAAVVELVAADQAAIMALEGWKVVTQGAALSDQLVDLVQDHLDSHARG